MNLKLTELEFPVLCQSHESVYVEQTANELATCTKTALKNGWYKRMLIVDSKARAIRIKDARKLHGVGLFWGYDIFLNQRIRVELEAERDPVDMSLEDVKTLINNSFKKRHGWQTRGDFEELQEKVHKAQTIPELITLLKK